MALSVTLAAGALIGLLLGMLGAGGSIIAVPALTLAVGLPLREAIATALVVVLCSSLSALLPRLRKGVEWSTAAIMIVSGIPCTFVGASLGHRLDERVLAFGFAATMILAAVFLLRAPTETRPETRARGFGRVVRAAVAGGMVGTLTGLLGVGGGFLIVPALTLVLDLPMTLAVGTSLAVISTNAFTGLIAQLSAVSLDWSLTATFTVMTMVAATFASQYGIAVSDRALRRAFCSLIVTVSLVMLVTPLH